MPGKHSVTGISPASGSPGMRLTIRGQYLGNSKCDIQHVFIGGTDVSLSLYWHSPSKITVITPMLYGELEIAVMINNEFGTSEVKYFQIMTRAVGPQQQVTFWPEDERKTCPAIISSGKDAQDDNETPSSNTVIDSKTGLPISQLVYLDNALPDNDLQEIYLNSRFNFALFHFLAAGSVHLTDPDFDPVLFLLKYCRTCSQMEKLKLAITDDKANLSKSARVEDEFSKALASCTDCGKALFADILSKREYADSARNCLSIMQKFQFLFYLPEKIGQNIARRQYTQVINDYVRARSLFAYSDVDAFRKIFQDVELKMTEFKDDLRQKLNRMPIDFEEAKSVIGFLFELDVEFDPAWLCLNNFKSWLLEGMSSCYQLYRAQCITSQSGANTLKSMTIDSNSKDASTRFLSRHRSSTIHGSVKKFSETSVELSASNQAQSILIFTESICQLLQKEMVEFWRLGNAYVRNQLPSRQKTHSGLSNARKHISIRPKSMANPQISINQPGSFDLADMDELEYATPYDTKASWSVSHQRSSFIYIFWFINLFSQLTASHSRGN
ncbi:Exocyst complex component 2 [Cichlidogyrus casuarinus]|uniref:Exocyst complex component 2 n=1 Tax=Cichlidogyrus casuarinus TaxID=1844966 RepID=A0ABD2Q5U8_9PLAT